MDGQPCRCDDTIHPGKLLTIDSRTFRQILGRYATGVAMITTATSDGRDVGVTVSSFGSVSLDPPLVLFSMGLSSNITPIFAESKKFVVNILSYTQQDVSNRFARPSTADWQGIPVVRARNGLARLEQALASIECDLEFSYPGGDHVIYVGRVTHCHAGADAEPLLFFRSNYGTYLRGASVLPAESIDVSSGYDYGSHSWS